MVRSANDADLRDEGTTSCQCVLAWRDSSKVAVDVSFVIATCNLQIAAVRDRKSSLLRWLPVWQNQSRAEP